MELTHTLVLVNPNSGTADIQEITNITKKIGLDLKIAEYKGHITEIINTLKSNEIKNVIICGGDGTVTEAANAVLEKAGLHLGIIPCGTGNDLCRTLGIPLSIEEAFAGLKQAQHKSIDVGFLQTKNESIPFFNVSATGFSGEIDKHLEDKNKKLWGTLAYYKSGIKALSNLEPFKVKVKVKDKILTECMALNCIVGNGKYAAGGIPIAPEASIDDGLLDLMLYKGDGIWDQLSNTFAITEGSQLEDTQVECIKLNEFTLEFDRALHANYDGELLSEKITSIQYRIHKKKLPLLVQML